MSTQFTAIRTAVGQLLPLPSRSRLVAATLKDDGSAVVVLVHIQDPEKWLAGVWSSDEGWVQGDRFSPSPSGFQAACTEFVRLSSAFVQEYPSWATAENKNT